MYESPENITFEYNDYVEVDINVLKLFQTKQELDKIIETVNFLLSNDDDAKVYLESPTEDLDLLIDSIRKANEYIVGIDRVLEIIWDS